VDERGESTGGIRYYCSTACRATDPDGKATDVPGVDTDYLDGTVCDLCGRDVAIREKERAKGQARRRAALVDLLFETAVMLLIVSMAVCTWKDWPKTALALALGAAVVRLWQMMVRRNREAL
jgi:hypothetical protein